MASHGAFSNLPTTDVCLYSDIYIGTVAGLRRQMLFATQGFKKHSVDSAGPFGQLVMALWTLARLEDA